MASSMLDTVLESVTPEMRQSLATRLGESPQAVQTGLRAASGATLQGLASRSTDPQFSSQVLQMAGNAGSQNLLGNLSSIASGGSTGAFGDLTNRFTSLVFGNQQGQATQMVAQHSGISIASAGGLLKMAAPLILGHLAKMHSAGTLSPSSFASVFKSGTAELGGYTLHPSQAEVPRGTARAAPGVTETSADVLDRTGRVVTARPADRPTRWVVPAVIVAVALLGWLVARSMHHSRPTNVALNTTSTDCVAADTAARGAGAMGTNGAALGNLIPVNLPDGRQINVPACGVEKRLIDYLGSSAAPAGQVTFVFDRVSFDPDQATLQPQSIDQLNSVAAIMKAYPTAKIGLGGYTDNSGDAATNQTLSANRANTVMVELTKRGVDPSRLSAQGYGDNNPVADNSTAAGRQQNQRIAIRVAEK